MCSDYTLHQDCKFFINRILEPHHSYYDRSDVNTGCICCEDLELALWIMGNLAEDNTHCRHAQGIDDAGQIGYT